MVDMGDDAKVAIALNWDICDALLEVCLGSEDVGVAEEEFRKGGRKSFTGEGRGTASLRAPTLQKAARGPDA
jgi:hypothetical protein